MKDLDKEPSAGEVLANFAAALFILPVAFVTFWCAFWHMVRVALYFQERFPWLK